MTRYVHNVDLLLAIQGERRSCFLPGGGERSLSHFLATKKYENSHGRNAFAPPNARSDEKQEREFFQWIEGKGRLLKERKSRYEGRLELTST